MLRPILAVVGSYVAMAVFVMAVFMGLWFGMGPDRLLVPGTWEGNMILCIAAPAITATAGLLGGLMCAKIGRGRGPVLALAGLVLVLGLTMAYFTLKKPEPTGPRPAGMTVQQVMEQGREPAWVAISNPIIGAVGVLCAGLGALRSRRRAE